jgi:rhodanese-related sulfurtransferase
VTEEHTDEHRVTEEPRDETPESPEVTDEPLSPEDARILIGRNEVDVIDIREDGDAFAEGHLAGATHVPGGNSDSLPADLSGERALIIVCESGEQSAEVAERFRKDGRDATSIDGGMDAWRGAGLPVQPTNEAEFQGPKLKTPGT